MSAGAVFKLIANDGKADRLIMATKLLNQRIKDVMCARTAAGKADITPTIVDLERTHILFVNAHFKPFAAIGYEYNKTKPQSGSAMLGSSITFSIPQFGDFFHDMVVRVRLGQFQANPGATPVQGSSGGALFPFNGFTPDGDVAANLYYNLVDFDGNVVVAGVSSDPADSVPYRNFVRYCEYPGNRLFRKVKFDVNGNPLDEYDDLVPVMLEKFCTPPNKRVGHDRLVGQEVPLTGYGSLKSCAVVDSDLDSTGVANTPTSITKFGSEQSNQTTDFYIGNTLGPLTDSLSSSTSNYTPLNVPGADGQIQREVSRQMKFFVSGPQTPKPIQPPLEILNKLRFWFNDDVRLSIPSVSIPFGQRFITIDLQSQNNLAFEVPSLFLETIAYPAGASVPIGTVAAQRVVTYTPLELYWGMSDIQIERLELYINNIFVNPEVHDIYIKRIAFTLIRVYRENNSRVNQEGTDEKLLSSLKWPIEYMFVGMRPVFNTKVMATGNTSSVSFNHNVWRDWHRMTRQVDIFSPDGSRSESATAASLAATGSYVSAVEPDHYWRSVSTVNSMSLTSHGITIYDSFSDLFFSQYLTYQYGGPLLCTPEDTGALFINMALFPRSYQPSGHLNISRARETYLRWTTNYISAKTPADLIVVGVAINFLLISDGSAVLRYST